MKKVNVKSVLMIIVMFFSLENLFRNLRTPMAVNYEGGDANTIGVGKERKRKKVSSINFRFGKLRLFYGGRDRTGKIIILMSDVNPNQSIRAALLAPRDKDGRVNLGNKIRIAGAITTWITIPPLQLADLIPLIKAVNDARTENEMNSAWFALNKALRKIMQLVQNCMDDNIDESANICALYGFTLAGKGGKHEQIFEGFTGSVTGTADMLAEVGPNGSAYVWYKWNTERTIRTYIKTSTYAHCTIGGQVSHIPINVSCDTIEGEEPIHESQIIEVVPK